MDRTDPRGEGLPPPPPDPTRTSAPGSDADAAEAAHEAPAQTAASAPEQPPFTPMPPIRAAGYFFAALVLALSQGFGQNLISANVDQLQGAFGATRAETTWLTAAYLAPNVSLTLALIKIRAQYGLRNFAEVSIIGFVAATLLNYAADDLTSHLAVRFMSGMAAAPMTTLAFLYTLEPLPPHRKMNVGLATALTLIFIGMPVTRIVSPHLLDIGLWHGLTAMEVALALVAFGLIYLLPLSSPPRVKAIQAADVVSYLLIAVGFGAAAIALTLGPIYWWQDAAWIGWLLVVAIGTTGLAAMVELNRERPLLDIRWLASPPVLHFTGVLLVFRIVLSEQTTGVAGLFRALGLYNAQTGILFAVILAATVAGGAVCAFALKPGRDQAFHAVALVLLIIGALMDSEATRQTRPHDMLLSQGLIAFASALFLPPALLSGLMSALAKGREYILSFIIVFLTTQKLGGVLGAAAFTTFIQLRQTLHLQRLTEDLVVTDPFVSEHLARLAGVYAPLTVDPVARAGEGLSALSREATAEATVLAYNDAFLVIAALAATALAALLVHMAVDALRARRLRAADPRHPSPQPA